MRSPIVESMFADFLDLDKKGCPDREDSDGGPCEFEHHCEPRIYCKHCGAKPPKAEPPAMKAPEERLPKCLHSEDPRAPMRLTAALAAVKAAGAQKLHQRLESAFTKGTYAEAFKVVDQARCWAQIPRSNETGEDRVLRYMASDAIGLLWAVMT